MTGTESLTIILPDLDQEPRYDPVHLVLELGLCTEDDLWEL